MSGVRRLRVLGAETATVPLSTLRLWERNPRRGDLEAIKESLRCNGQYGPLIVNRRSMEVLVGNHRLLAMRELGWREAFVCLIDVDEEQAKRIALADNRTSDLAGYDTAGLADLLQELDELVGTCYEQRDLDALLDELNAASPVDDDEVLPRPRSRTRRSAI
jgi:ParB-like chromosome segregation protein Spo0J